MLTMMTSSKRSIERQRLGRPDEHEELTALSSLAEAAYADCKALGVDGLSVDDDGLAIIRNRAEWTERFRPSGPLNELPDDASLGRIWTEFTFEDGERSVIKNGLWRESEAVCHYVSEVAVPEDVAVWVLEPPPQSRWNDGSGA